MTSNVNDSLRNNQRKAIEALLDGFTKQQAATAAGVQPATLSRWLADPEFRDVLTSLSDVALKDAAVRLKATLDTAVTVMRETMTDGDIHAGVRLRAADMAASHALKLLEVADLVERIEQLERRIGNE
jgi:hypothetical protein